MSLKKHIRLISIILLFCLLAWYSQHFLRETQGDMLVRTWKRTFSRLNADCIYWITLRLTAWILIYLRLLRLENGFSIYLFLRQGSYWKVFMRTYAECIGMVLCYYGVGTLIMAVYHGMTISGVNIENLLWQSGLPQILAEESLECLSFCLTAYVVHYVFRKAEVGFLVVLAGRLLLNFATGGVRLELPVQMTVNLVMTSMVFFIAFHDFTEKFVDI